VAIARWPISMLMATLEKSSKRGRADRSRIALSGHQALRAHCRRLGVRGSRDPDGAGARHLPRRQKTVREGAARRPRIPNSFVAVLWTRLRKGEEAARAKHVRRNRSPACAPFSGIALVFAPTIVFLGTHFR